MICLCRCASSLLAYLHHCVMLQQVANAQAGIRNNGNMIVCAQSAQLSLWEAWVHLYLQLQTYAPD